MKFFQDNERKILAVNDGDPVAICVPDENDPIAAWVDNSDRCWGTVITGELGDFKPFETKTITFEIPFEIPGSQPNPALRPTLHFDRDSKWDWLSDKVRGFIGLR